MSGPVKDDHGELVASGDLIRFSYGIPPKGVEARIIERNGHLIALTPHETPKECRLDKLRKLVGGFYKITPRAEDPREIEANIFRSRRALSTKPAGGE